MLTNANNIDRVMKNRLAKMPLNQGLNHKMIRNDKVFDRVMENRRKPGGFGYRVAANRVAAKTAKRVAEKMTGWENLEVELDAWEAQGKTATLWWRDDDAVCPTPQLERLVDLSGATSTPLALAVIPSPAEDSLSAYLSGHPLVCVIQHGYAHINHTDSEDKKSELGPERPADEILAELARGWGRLEGFKNRLAVLVPPWNRINPELVSRLPLLGLSTFGPRRGAEPAPGLIQVNTHADIMDWRKRRFIGPEADLESIIKHLSGRREGAVDAAEPTGLLTHHKDHDEGAWEFLKNLMARIHGHPAAGWLSAKQVFWP